MTFQQELASWMSPSVVPISPTPNVGSKAPSSSQIPIPSVDKKPIIIGFLRHTGCPFAEKAFTTLRDVASTNPSIKFIAVSHSSQEATTKWIGAVGGPGAVEVIVDEQREIYGQWGVGISNSWHVLSPWVMYSVYQLGKEENIWNKPTESGSRWQTAGSFAVDAEGVVKWAKVAQSANDIPDLNEALEAVISRR